MAEWKLTIRHASDVERQSFDGLEPALDELRRNVERVRGEGILPRISALRDFEPADRVQARFELSSGGWLRGREAGLDLKGDGTLVPYRGAIRKQPLEAGGLDGAIEAIRRELA